MPPLIKKPDGDKVIWFVTAALLLGSFLAVFSTLGSNPGSSLSSIFLKYFLEILLSLILLFVCYKVNYRMYRLLSWLGIFLAISLLVVALSTGRMIGGQMAHRWVYVGPFSFQPSSFAIIAVVVFTARFLNRLKQDRKKYLRPVKYIFQLWLWIIITAALIAPANLSTALLLASVFYIMLIVGGYPLKHILVSWLIALVAGGGVFMAYRAFPETFKETRLSTWESRIETFFSDEPDPDARRQQEDAKTAIALGSIPPSGPGKSVQKYFLPQADSDFMFAILVEEYSWVGGLVIIGAFILILFRCSVHINKSKDFFGKHLIFGLSLMLCLQAVFHICVNMGIFPVTGQNLPFISSGGTGAMASCVAIGIIQSVIRGDKNYEDEKDEQYDELPQED